MRLLLVDDHKMVIHLLRDHFQQFTPEIQVVGVVYDGPSAVEAAREYQPDVILLDLHLRDLDLDKNEVIRRIRWVSPGSRILLFTGCDNPSCYKLAFQAGATGIFLKGSSGDFNDLARAIDMTHKGMRVIFPDWLLSPDRTPGGDESPCWLSLTDQEYKALELAWEEELDNDGIAKALCITTGTFSNLRSRIAEKLHVGSWYRAVIRFGKDHLKDDENHHPMI